MNEKEWQIVCESISQQRNDAMNRVAMLQAQLATMQETLQTLTERLAKQNMPEQRSLIPDAEERN